MLDKIANAQFINGGTIALALGALSLALGHGAIFSLLALAGLGAYGVVIVRYFNKPKSSNVNSDNKESKR
jgi:hypothetical protein